MQTFAAAETVDPFFFAQEGLSAMADEQAIRLGLTCFRACRVFEIDQQDNILLAKVEDNQSGLPLTVEIRLSEDGKLQCRCDCPAETQTLCLHQVAVLCAYADQCGETKQLLGASDAAIRDRVKRGRSEVRVESLGGSPWFGDWLASSVSTMSHFSQQYRVQIRSLHRRANSCNCPDFSVNQLGPCKHIEAVLHKIAKEPDYDQYLREPAPISSVYLAWDVPEAPRLRLHRAQHLDDELRGPLDAHFDAAGMFLGRLPDDFFRLVEAIGHRSDIHFGDDAVDHAQHLAAAAAQRRRADEIRGLIRAANGRLPGVRARLYPYQVEGAAFLAGTGRALLADDMGLGKTLQAIAAAASYEERVLALLQGKQQLFDNVVKEDAAEDVVGISKKLLETLVEDLTGPASRDEEAGGESGQAPVAAETADEIVGPEQGGVRADDIVEQEITACVEQVQKAFGSRIERILGAGGGLLVGLDQVDAQADALAADLSRVVPVALVDRLTLNGLARLGAASPVAGARSYFAAEQDGATGGQSRLAALANEKLRAAALLLEQGLADSALELMLSALLAAAADRAGLSAPVPLREAGVWLYGQALPQGYLTEQEAALLLRAIGLAQCPTVPQELLRALALDTESFLAASLGEETDVQGGMTNATI